MADRKYQKQENTANNLNGNTNNSIKHNNNDKSNNDLKYIPITLI